MIEITVTTTGMMCGKCEAHMNDLIAATFDVRKVTSDHDAGTTIILAENDIADDDLKQAIATTKFSWVGATHAEKQASGLFGFMQ